MQTAVFSRRSLRLALCQMSAAGPPQVPAAEPEVKKPYSLALFGIHVSFRVVHGFPEILSAFSGRLEKAPRRPILTIHNRTRKTRFEMSVKGHCIVTAKTISDVKCAIDETRQALCAEVDYNVVFSDAVVCSSAFTGTLTDGPLNPAAVEKAFPGSTLSSVPEMAFIRSKDAFSASLILKTSRFCICGKAVKTQADAEAIASRLCDALLIGALAGLHVSTP